MGFLLLIGVIAMIAGVISLIKPLSFLRIRSRAMGAAVLIAGIILSGVGGSGQSEKQLSTVGTERSAPDASTSESAQATDSPVVSTPTPTDSPTQPSTSRPQTESDTGLGDGTYVVGTDIKAGTYRSQGGGLCYWARLKGFGGELDDIIANGNNAPEIVTVSSGDAGFKTQGCGKWVPIDETKPASAATEFGDGTYQVGVHIKPGTYRSDGTDMCYWARLKGFGHTIDDIIANGNNSTVVTIKESDLGFTSFGCGTWSAMQ